MVTVNQVSDKTSKRRLTGLGLILSLGLILGANGVIWLSGKAHSQELLNVDEGKAQAEYKVPLAPELGRTPEIPSTPDGFRPTNETL